MKQGTKWYYATLVCLCLFITCPRAASRQESDAPFSETAQWLSDTLSGNSFWYFVDKDDQLSGTYEVVRFEGSAMIIKRKDHWHVEKCSCPEGKVDRITTSTYYIPLSELDPTSVKVKTLDRKNNDPYNGYLVMASASTPKSSPIQWTSISYRNGKLFFNTKGTADEFEIYFTDKESAKRVSRALRHAITLAGGKVQPF